ncbi:ParA family protein [Micromonospora sp. WMMC273]|uniref:ParA family protein n=1 Tax=Micromonospora sp. WMMC273 TaxID=3015157 RepID=UPI0022B6E605|nr:ParA family protein [Micromonospora sp. WMMC273]MCZ7478827.1 ParA family protein [Micromonospora sp. WMMC273]MCZ7478955.1 ParA family protein [Micromonospora sp. WMMC273]MCZ7479003.1 ParA family protein [Micromonospora sp. WMMC273]
MSTGTSPAVPAPRVAAVDVVAPHHDTPEPLGRRLAFINNKGGVGKTLITAMAASGLAARGRRVLVVDMDPQANLTGRVAAEVGPNGSIGDVLARREKGGARAAIVRCGWDSPEAQLIDVLPASLSLEDRNSEAAVPGSHQRLNRVLYGVTDDYDYTLFDCRPALGHLEQNVVQSLEAENGDGVYIVAEPHKDAITGAQRVLAEVEEWADQLDIDVDILGVIVNLVVSNTKLHQGRVKSIPASLGDNAPPVLTPHIPRLTRIAEVTDLAVPMLYDPRLRREGVVDMMKQLAAAIDVGADA